MVDSLLAKVSILKGAFHINSLSFRLHRSLCTPVHGVMPPVALWFVDTLSLNSRDEVSVMNRVLLVRVRQKRFPVFQSRFSASDSPAFRSNVSNHEFLEVTFWNDCPVLDLETWDNLTLNRDRFLEFLLNHSKNSSFSFNSCMLWFEPSSNSNRWHEQVSAAEIHVNARVESDSKFLSSLRVSHFSECF